MGKTVKELVEMVKIGLIKEQLLAAKGGPPQCK